MHKFHSRDGNVCLPYTGGVVLKIYTTNLNEVQVANFPTPLNGTDCNVAKAGQLSLNRLFLGTGRDGGAWDGLLATQKIRVKVCGPLTKNLTDRTLLQDQDVLFSPPYLLPDQKFNT